MQCFAQLAQALVSLTVGTGLGNIATFQDMITNNSNLLLNQDFRVLLYARDFPNICQPN
jgi:hypothetical protein